MLAFLTGFCAGLALGWFTYVQREWLTTLLLINCGSACFFIFITIIMPSSSAAGSMDMNLLEFAVYVKNRIANDDLASLLTWLNVGFVVANIGTWFAYRGFEPEPQFEVPETRHEQRRRIEAEMGYEDSYFD